MKKAFDYKGKTMRGLIFDDAQTGSYAVEKYASSTPRTCSDVKNEK
jgi:hypothetical protein